MKQKLTIRLYTGLFSIGLGIAAWLLPTPLTQAEKSKAPGTTMTAEQLLEKMDANMVFETRRVMSEMHVHKRGRTRIKKMKSYSKGEDTSYSEFLYPARDKGVKYLKIGDNLWMYLPSAEKVVKISGHMLRQSMMGSDFSYEDMLESRKMRELYHAKIIKTEKIGKYNCYVLELKQKKLGLTYPKRRFWIAEKIYVPLRSEMYAASGRLMKVMTFSDIKVYNNRHYPMRMKMTNKLQRGTWTQVIMTDIAFKVQLPDQVFSLRNLQRE